MPSKLVESRYDFTPDGFAIVDIFVESVADLVHSFDRKAAFSKRELDQDFVEYLTDCLKEIGSHEFIVRISIEQEFNLIQENNLRKAIKHHFTYLHEIEKIKYRKEMQKFTLLMILGVSLLALISKYKIPDTTQAELWVKTLQEGLTIASWVAIWEALTAILFCWSPAFSDSKIFNRISQAEIRVQNVSNKIKI